MDELKKLLENAGILNEGSHNEWHVEDSSGDQYAIYFTSEDSPTDEMFVEANGIAIAHAVLGGAGIMKSDIKDPNALMEALFAFANNNER